jgi:hypothetical protein
VNRVRKYIEAAVVRTGAACPQPVPAADAQGGTRKAAWILWAATPANMTGHRNTERSGVKIDVPAFEIVPIVAATLTERAARCEKSSFLYVRKNLIPCMCAA